MEKKNTYTFKSEKLRRTHVLAGSLEEAINIYVFGNYGYDLAIYIYDDLLELFPDVDPVEIEEEAERRGLVYCDVSLDIETGNREWIYYIDLSQVSIDYKENN